MPLRVVENSQVAREAETVSSGVPLPREFGICNAGVLGVFDAENREIPAQFTVLSRWFGRPDDSTRPIKWVLVTFQADMDAVSERTFFLRRGHGVAPATPVRVTETPQAVQVDTGPMQFTVSRTAFNLFDAVTVEGRTLLQSSVENGFVLRDHTGRVFRSSNGAPESVVVEEAGPLRAVIRVEGQHRNGQDTCLRYIVRIHAYAGKSHVRVFHALRNDASYGYTNSAKAGHAYLTDYHLDLRLDVGGLVEATFRDESYLMGTGEYRVLEQDMAGVAESDCASKVKDTNLDLHDNFIRRIRDQQGRILTSLGGLDGGTTAGRDPGFLDLGNTKGGVAVGLRHFWQNFPKSLQGGADGLVRVGLWPEFGSYVDPGYYQRNPPPTGAEDDYTFGGGRQKTHEILLVFRAGPSGAARVRDKVEAFNHPLFATAPAHWFAQSRAIQFMVDMRDWAHQPGFTRDMGIDLNRFERFQRAKWCWWDTDKQPYLGHVTYKAFRQRGGTWGGRQFFGWMNYGDTPWGAGYCQGHYDWPFSTLASFVRSDERELLEMGVVMARHRMDIDQYHSGLDREDINYGQRFEKGDHHGDMTVPPTPSHTWIHGMLLYWALTGDSFAREAAEETLAFYRHYWSRHGEPFYGLGAEARTGGWSLMACTELYDYLGEPEALEIARKIVTGYINHEKEENTSGYYMAGAPTIMPWMYGIYLNGLGKYYFHTGQKDQEARALIDRIAAWLTGEPNGWGPMTGGTGPDSNYVPLNIWYEWHPEASQRSGLRRINGLHILDGLAYAYMATGKDVYLDTSIRFASDLWRYWTSDRETVDRNDLQQFEGITIRPTMFPNTESKILGWITRFGKVLHYATYMREVMPPILVDVKPKGSVSGPFTLRFSVTRNRPVLDENGRRTYDAWVDANGAPSTAVVQYLFQRASGPFRETWYAPLMLQPNETLLLDVGAWAAPWSHWIRTEIKGEPD